MFSPKIKYLLSDIWLPFYAELKKIQFIVWYGLFFKMDLSTSQHAFTKTFALLKCTAKAGGM